MKSLALFNYNTTSKLLAMLDARGKFLIFLWLNLASMFASYTFLALLCASALLIARIEGTKGLLRSMRGIMFLAILVLLARSISYEGKELINLYGIKISREGLFYGIIFAIRLVLMVIWAHLLISSTRINELEAAIASITRHIPIMGKFANHIAGALSLMLSFLPLITSEASSISESLKARHLYPSKHPIRYIVALGSTLLANMLIRIITMTEALYVRFYNFDTMRQLPDKEHLKPALALTLIVIASFLLFIDRTILSPHLSVLLSSLF
ncbi:energy-coupling factor transporter transmembrane component T [Spirochaetia bacterium 38H-sp]|uniref:Energy-coupling factor transporter transmembrane component T n=1 Tax=Rarispira pelagica TaxID=3141764 RepID=A0ABU9UBJ0_9SPIR